MSSTGNSTYLTSTEDAPIGVFDSGIGGLSILQALTQAMPHRRFIYMADTAYAPYGERTNAYILERSQHIARWMHDEQKTCGLVIACNTATAAAGKILRETYGAAWPIVGVEPGLKPAALLSKTGRIAIMATASTLKSTKLQDLIARTHQQVQTPLEIFLCPCDGLAKAIEDNNVFTTNQLIAQYTNIVKAAGSDVIVLGCTHYCLVADRIAEALPDAHILDTAQAVARHAQTIFPGSGLPFAHKSAIARVDAWTNANRQLLEEALHRWLPNAHTQVHTWAEPGA